ncbi:MAG TPA: SGNH/GDSL hydrolase family protein [Vicinamibacteria bacterium]
MSPARRRLATLGLVTGAVLATLAALEIVFRLAGVSVGTVQINRGTVRRSPNPRLGYELRPGAHVRAEVEYRISSGGLRSPEALLVKPPGVRRVAVLGDSIAFGYWVADERTFARQLEAMLGPSVQVLNFGVPGYNLEQEIEVLRTKALAYDPDLVVVAFCLNDLEGIFSYEFGLTLDRSARSATIGGRLLEGLLRRSLLASWVEYRLAELEARRRFAEARNPLAGPLYAEAVAEQRKALAAHFRTLRELLASRGLPGLVAVFPTLGNRFPNYPYRELHAAVLDSARDEGLLALDLLDCFSAYDFHDLRVDVVHPSPLGHRVAAHAIRDALCGRGLLCDGASAQALSCTGYRVEDFPRVRGY